MGEVSVAASARDVAAERAAWGVGPGNARLYMLSIIGRSCCPNGVAKKSEGSSVREGCQ